MKLIYSSNADGSINVYQTTLKLSNKNFGEPNGTQNMGIKVNCKLSIDHANQCSILCLIRRF